MLYIFNYTITEDVKIVAKQHVNDKIPYIYFQ